MPEPLATAWLLMFGAGGYILAALQFFRDFLNVRKLELEISELQEKIRARESAIYKPTVDEIDKYSRPKVLRIHAPWAAPSLMLIAAVGLAGLLTSVGYFELHDREVALEKMAYKWDTEREIVRQLTSRIERLEDKLRKAERSLSEKEAALERLRPSSGANAGRKPDAQPNDAGDAPEAARP
jgi:hypothetical protein